MSDFGWFMIGIIGVALSISLGVVFSPPSLRVNNDVEMARQGLEECTKSTSTYKTLWVKDCVAYLQFVEQGKVDPNRNMVSGGQVTLQDVSSLEYE